MSFDYKKISDNLVNYIIWNFNFGVVLDKNIYNFLLLYLVLFYFRKDFVLEKI